MSMYTYIRTCSLDPKYITIETKERIDAHLKRHHVLLPPSATSFFLSFSYFIVHKDPFGSCDNRR